MFTIYKISNDFNHMIYIGFTTTDIDFRFKQHIVEARCRANSYLHKAIKKHGAEHFTISTMKQGEDHEWGLKVEEPYHIAVYKSNDRHWGYNMGPGGDGTLGRVFTEEHKRNLSKSITGRKLSPEHIEKLKSHRHSPETKEKMSRAMKGRFVSQETRQRMSISAKAYLARKLE